ncbi:MAG: SpoIIE family protein phosphatase, partial [Leptospiraceae bacterium]|nr:SpoIIE family protein phosphatase [Leptospiraceae bacterium]
YVYFAHIVFPKEVSRIFTYVNIFIFFLFSSIVVITPMEFYTEILFLPQALSLIGMFYISVGFIRAYINKREGAIYTLFGCIIFYLACTNDILYARGVVNTGYFLSIGFLFLVLSQSMLLSHRYSKTYLEARMNYEKLQESNTELLSLKNDLEVIVDKRTNELNSTLEKIKKDITTARNIQLGILPKINKNPKLEFSIFFQTMEEVGGDYYDIVELNPNFYRIFLADATGHGIQAGMITMLIKSEYEGLKFLLQGPDQILTTLNLEFYKRFSNLKTYFSCILLDIDLNSNKIYYSSAGHPEQYMVTDGSIKPIYSKGYWVGFSKLFSAKLEVYDFKPGDRLFLFTDGLYEEFNSKQEEFGVERIKKILLNKDLNSIEHVNLKLIDSLSDFLDFKPFQDDITIINIERKKLS